MLTEPHEFGERGCIQSLHCAGHDRDEMTWRPVQICGECWHRYVTWFELWRTYVGEFYADWWHTWRRGDLPDEGLLYVVRALVLMPFIRPKRIPFCPHCLHDF